MSNNINPGDEMALEEIMELIQVDPEFEAYEEDSDDDALYCNIETLIESRKDWVPFEFDENCANMRMFYVDDTIDDEDEDW